MARIPNLPAAGKPVVFKLSAQCRKDLIELRRALTEITNSKEPVSISECIRAAIRLALQDWHKMTKPPKRYRDRPTQETQPCPTNNNPQS